MNTSMGYHTFAFFQKMNEEEFSIVTGDFILYAKKNKYMKRFPVKDRKGRIKAWEYTYENKKGIRWLLMSSQGENGFSIKGVMAVINPKALIEDNYITAAREEDFGLVERIFNNEATNISPIILELGLCSLNRVDPCLNIDLQELGMPCSPEQMIALIKKGNIPASYKEREEYDAKKRRKVTDKNSFYLTNKSSVINFYWKYPQQKRKHPNYLHREDSRYVIRFEVQCGYLKLYAMSKGKKKESKLYKRDEGISMDELFKRIEANEIYHPSIPMDVVLTDRILEEVVQKYFYKVIRKGDYLTLDDARDIVLSYHFRRDKEERMIYALESVKEYHGIAGAKSKLYGPDLNDFKRSLKDLDDILVNPVTIPRRWNIKHISNPLSAYYDSIYAEQLIPGQEYWAGRHIDEILSK